VENHELLLTGLAMQALSAFAEYVEEQQSIRYPTTRGPTTVAASTVHDEDGTEHHEELDELFETLDLEDSAPRVPLKQLLLATDDASIQKLEKVVVERLAEGFGEAVFELGFEDSGEPMDLKIEEWNQAYRSLDEAAHRIRANCQLLMTKNVGGDVEAPSVAENPGKSKGCSGKVLVRQQPGVIEDVIETRIAVVGNGMIAVIG
jgi:GTPase